MKPLSAQPQEVIRTALEAAEARELAEVAASLVDRFGSPENPDFLRDATFHAQALPEGLRKGLLRFALGEPAGALVLSGVLVDDEALGPTPAHWREEAKAEPAVRLEMVAALLGSLVGELFGWATQQDGSIVHNIVPIKGHEREQLGSSSADELTWHTEDAFHPNRGDYLGLLCLRNPDAVSTTLATSDGLTLSEDAIRLLFEPRFTIKPDESHLPKNNESGADFGRVESMMTEPERVAVLFGEPDRPYMRLDPYFMETPDTSEAADALQELISAIDATMSGVVLAPGEFLLVDNYRSVHGRVPFRARFDGTDRWLKRVNMTRNLRDSRSERLRPESRVIGEADLRP